MKHDKLMKALALALALAALPGFAGKISDGQTIWNVSHVARKHLPGVSFRYDAWAPSGVKDGAALYLLLEHSIVSNSTERIVLREQMLKGEIPPGLVINFKSGELAPSLPGKDRATRWMRPTYLDQPGTEFPNYLVEELIPDAAARLGVTIDPSPERHFTTGGSSGGIAAWNIAWHRNDYFRRVFLSSPTFSAMRGGEEIMPIVRKSETRPIKIFMTIGTREPDYFFGDSFLVTLNAASAFKHAGYDCSFEVFEHEGHCARINNPDLWRRMMPWLFAGWKTNAVVTCGNPPRVRQNIPAGTHWRECNFKMPPPQTEVVSTDGWRAYSVSPDSRFVTACSITKDGRRENPLVLSNLHIAWNARRVGGSALALLYDDRVLVATDLGIQSVVSLGLTDLILPLPGDLPADNVTVVGKTLYASSGSRVFARPLTRAGADHKKLGKPWTPGYGDDFDYSREHLPITAPLHPPCP